MIYIVFKWWFYDTFTIYEILKNKLFVNISKSQKLRSNKIHLCRHFAIISDEAKTRKRKKKNLKWKWSKMLFLLECAIRCGCVYFFFRSVLSFYEHSTRDWHTYMYFQTMKCKKRMLWLLFRFFCVDVAAFVCAKVDSQCHKRAIFPIEWVQ